MAEGRILHSDAGKWLEKAEAFAKAHPNDPLLCAIRYFEVADRFTGSQESLIAQRKSLDLMGRITAPAVTNDGEKVFKFKNLTLKFNWPTIINVIDACPGRQWYMVRDGAQFPIGVLPQYLKGTNMVQQNDHRWIGGFECSRPVTVFVAVRISYMDIVDVSENELKELSGWRVLNDKFTTAGVSEQWKWKLIGKRCGAGKVTLENPLKSKDAAIILFVE